MKILQLTLVLIAIISPATVFSYVSSEGHEYGRSCNADGYVLASRYPVTRMVGSGANALPKSGIETLYLGKSCDAYSKLFGAGKWCWANGGFLVEFGNESLGFPRQELYCASNETLGQQCVCQ